MNILSIWIYRNNDFLRPLAKFQIVQAGLQQPHFRQELEEVAAENPDRFKLWYTIDRSSVCTEAEYLGHLLHLGSLFPFKDTRSLAKVSINVLLTSMIWWRQLHWKTQSIGRETIGSTVQASSMQRWSRNLFSLPPKTTLWVQIMATTHLLIIFVTKYSGHSFSHFVTAYFHWQFVRCWCAVHLQWSTSPASPTWTSWATASIRDSPTRRCVTASRTIDAFQPPLRIFWDRASWTIMCSLGREHFIPLTLPTCDHAIYLSIICINIPGVLSKR